MSVSVTISGEIIQSQNYLSNYFLTLNSDQTISGNKTFNNLSASSLNVTGQINVSNLNITGEINSSTLKSLFGSQNISSSQKNGTIYFGKSFDLEPFVTITQYSNRIVPIAITSVNTSSFSWCAASTNVGKIMWSAGIN